MAYRIRLTREPGRNWWVHSVLIARGIDDVTNHTHRLEVTGTSHPQAATTCEDAEDAEVMARWLRFTGQEAHVEEGPDE